MKSIACVLFFSLISACGTSPSKSAKSWAGYKQSGEASYYADKYHGRTTANGEKFNQKAATAAHKKLPFGSKVKVTNKANGKSVVVRINDRGPFVRGRIIDLSKSAFRSIGNTKAGVLDVKIVVLK